MKFNKITLMLVTATTFVIVECTANNETIDNIVRSVR